MNLGDLGEFGLIDRIAGFFDRDNSDIVIGIGDDAAAIRKGEGIISLVTSDMLLEDIHFDLRYTAPNQLGEKALAVNISDIAAMGGTPRFFLLSIALPKDTEVDFVENFSKGAALAASRFGVTLIGGDTVASDDKILISITLIGEAPEREVLCRNGANPGDQIFVTGTIGDSAAGLKLLKKGINIDNCSPENGELIKKHLSPSPRVDVARYISRNHLATSMIDISDGLLKDMGHICESSKAQGKIWLDRIPLSSSYIRVAKDHGFNIKTVLAGGEDYELLFTIPMEKVEELDKLERNFDCTLTHIGEICPGNGVLLYDHENNIIDPGMTGYDHFS
ncbi:MAG: thiamine-phosphate kinase [bacterium]|nr:thiamine-phosphate kinase [bacterium]